MGRTVSWGEEILHNALKLVEALLMLYEGKLQLDDLEAVQVEWISADKLQVTGKTKQQTKGGKPTVKKGTTKEALLQLIQKAGFELKFSKRKSTARSADDPKKEIQKVFDNLRRCEGLFKDDRPPTQQNSACWIFTLKLKGVKFEIKENLKVIEEKWKEQNPEETSPEPAPDNRIDWQGVCRAMLDKQREAQKFRRQITGRGLGHEVDVYVPLGLTQPKAAPRRDEDFSPQASEGSRQYQLTETESKKYEYQQFLDEVIGKAENNIAIAGEPGAGKTTWLEQIAFYLDKAEKAIALAIAIPLASVGEKTLEEFLLQNWLKDALPFIDKAAGKVTPGLEEEFIKLFNSGKVWLLLDGADEMRVSAPLQQIAQQLTGWVDRARVVLIPSWLT